VLLDAPDTPVDPLAAYRWVPAAERQKHASAAERLAKLGAIVGPNICRNNGPTPGSYWRMYKVRQGLVCLPRIWRGERGDLQLLAGLHALTELEICRSPVTDEQLAGLTRLENLKKLTLYETNVTDNGLAHLRPGTLPQLEYLRLETSAEGYELTDQGLSHVVRLPTLKELVLFGPGFSDKGLETLAKLPRQCRLQSNGTRFTREGLTALKKKRPDLSWRDD
jgi:hypothetical protein